MTHKVSVEVFYPEGRSNEIGFTVLSPEGTSLTARVILDAISECLELYYSSAPSSQEVIH